MPNEKVIDVIKGGDTKVLVSLLLNLRGDLLSAVQQHVNSADSAMERVEEIDRALKRLGGDDGGASVSCGRDVQELRGEEPKTKT